MKKLSYWLIVVSVLALSMKGFSQAPNWMPAGGLVAWYPFNGNSHDETVHGYNCTNANPSYVVLTKDRWNASNKAYHFDMLAGSEDGGLYCNNYPIAPVKYTYTAWFKAEQFVSYYGVQVYAPIVARVPEDYTVVSPYYPISMCTFGIACKDTAVCATYCNNWNPYKIPFAKIDTSSWHFYAVSYDGSVMKAYVDGVMVKEQNVPFTDGVSKYFGIGCTFNYSGNYMHPLVAIQGKIDDVSVHSRALTDDEIVRIYLNYSGVGVQEAEISRVEINPNPCDGVCRVTSRDNILNVQVFDSGGKLVMQYRPVNNEEYLDLSSKPKGLYIVKVFTRNGVTTTKLIIK